jgi:hypothetical protein
MSHPQNVNNRYDCAAILPETDAARERAVRPFVPDARRPRRGGRERGPHPDVEWTLGIPSDGRARRWRVWRVCGRGRLKNRAEIRIRGVESGKSPDISREFA